MRDLDHQRLYSHEEYNSLKHSYSFIENIDLFITSLFAKDVSQLKPHTAFPL